MKRASPVSPFAAGALGIALAGCATTPAPAPISTQELPVSWSEPIPASGDVWPEENWWKGFKSAELDRLVTTARASNLDLVAAAARVLQAHAQATIARAQLFPVIGAEGAVQNQGASVSGTSVNNNLAGLAGEVSYQADFWGVARNNVAAARALLKSARYAQETVAITVISDVASLYLDVLQLRQRRAIAMENLEAAQRILDAIQKRLDNGLSSPLDLAQQQALVAGQAATIPALEQEERDTIYRLSVLLGRAPEGFTVAGDNLDSLTIPSVVPGLPSELLLRRPDIAEAEARLVAANANINAARAAFFPQISLSVTAGGSSGALSAVTDAPVIGFAAAAGGTGLLYGIGASIIQTIFDGGRRQGGVDLATAQQQELVAGYRNAVFQAFSGVETALNRTARLSDQERLKAEQASKAAIALDIATVQYREGFIDLLALLQTQQTLFTTQDQLVQIRAARVQALIELFKALGGGWSADTETALQ